MAYHKKTTLKKTLKKNKTLSKREYVYGALLAIVKLDVLLKPIKWSLNGLRRHLSRASSKSERAVLRQTLLQNPQTNFQPRLKKTRHTR